MGKGKLRTEFYINGNETKPSKEYLFAIDAFSKALVYLHNINRKNEGVNASYNKTLSSYVTTNLLSRSATLASQLPFSPFNKNEAIWDYATSGIITRSILELRLTLYYLCIESVTDDERDLRLKVFQLHDCHSRIKLFRNFPIPDETQIAHFENQKVLLISELTANPRFKSLSVSKQRDIKKGKVVYISSLEDIGCQVGIDRNEFKVYYQLLSSFGHGYPINIMRMGSGNRGRGTHSPAEEGYTKMFIELATKMLEDVAKEYEKLFSE